MAYRGDPRSTRQWQRLCAEVRTYAEYCELPRCLFRGPGDPPVPIDFDAEPRSPRSFSVDHMLSVRDYPELAFDPQNVRPGHYRCNSARGDGRRDDLEPPPFVTHDDTHSRDW